MFKTNPFYTPDKVLEERPILASIRIFILESVIASIET